MTNAKIQVGEWIRTDWGKIDKVLEVENIRATKEHLVHSTIDTYARECITKHSFNIIDLIEVGDYVNGQRIQEVEKGFKDGELYFVDALDNTIWCNEESKIKTIVTHERFAKMEYKVGGEDD